jgi:DNA primase
LRFVMDYEHVDFPTAVRRLAQRAGIPVVEDAPTADDAKRHGQRERLLALHAETASWFHRNLMKSPDAAHARDYLKTRGIGVATAKTWQLGYAPDSWDALLAHLRERRFSTEEIMLGGLASSKEGDDGAQGRIYSRFRGRLMFPINNDYGEVVAFSGRVLQSESSGAKYVNSPETPLFTKGRVLFGLDKTKRDLIEKNAAIVCEGQLDLITAFEAGVRNVIAPQGTAFTSDQARLLKRYVETVFLCFDSDIAGKKAADRSLPALFSQGLLVRIVSLPQGDDPDSLIRREGPEAFLERVENAPDYFEHNINEAGRSGELIDATAKSRLVRRLAPALALVGDAVLRESTLGKMASRLGVPQSTIRQIMKAPPQANEAQPEGSPSTDTTSLELSPGMQILCRLAIQSADVRAWLRGQQPLARFESAGDLVDKVARAEFEEGVPLPAAFLATLDPSEERVLAALAGARAMPEALERAMQTAQGMLARQLNQQIEIHMAEVSNRELTTEERQKIQKQILDLKIRVADVHRPFEQA